MSNCEECEDRGMGIGCILLFLGIPFLMLFVMLFVGYVKVGETTITVKDTRSKGRTYLINTNKGVYKSLDNKLFVSKDSTYKISYTLENRIIDIEKIPKTSVDKLDK